jgi:hypothetical protein
MKTITLFFFFLFALTLTAHAQITKGNWLVGGNLTYGIQEGESNSNGNKSTSKGSALNLNADIGYFVINKLSVGLTPYFGFGNPDGSNNSSIGFGIGPFARYYFLKPEKILNIFSQLEYYYGNSYSNGKKESESNGYSIKNGVAIFLNNSIAFEVSLNYNVSKNNYESGYDSKFKDFNIGVGFQIHLEKTTNQ